MDSAAARIIEAIVMAAISPWSWGLVLAYIVFLGNARWKIHGVLESLWAGAQAMARVADRLGTMEKKLDTIIELQKPVDDGSIRLSIPK